MGKKKTNGERKRREERVAVLVLPVRAEIKRHERHGREERGRRSI